MAERESSIVADARTTLNDENTLGLRWTDKRLYQLLDDAQQDMCRELPLVALKTTINTVVGQEEYQMPQDSVEVLTARASGKTLTITSMEELDRDNDEWEEKTSSSFTHIVVNRLSQNTIRPYPLLVEGSSETVIKLRYSALPVDLGWNETTEVILEELTVDSMWDFALKQYIISMAFLDYGDEGSTSRAATAKSFYDKEIANARKLSKSSFSKRVRTTAYQARVAPTRTVRRQYGSR